MEPASESTMPESLGWQLRAALPPLRLHSVSLYDVQGEVLWLSEGALGPDEHGFVVEALDRLKGSPSGMHCESDFRDGRGAVFLAVRAPRSELVGLVMILVDGKALAAGSLAPRIMTPAVQAILQRLAIWLYPLSKAAPEAPARAARAEPPGREGPAAPAAAASPARPAASAGPATPAGSAAPPAAPTTPANPSPPPGSHQADSTGTISLEILAPKEVDEILTFELSKEALPRSATVAEAPPATIPEPRLEPPHPDAERATPHETSPSAAAEPSRAAAEPPVPAGESRLQVQELAKLRPGGRMRRFQVMPHGPNASADAAQTLVAPLRELVAWLEANAPLTERVPLAFSLTVSAPALEAGRLPELLTDCLRNTAVQADGIGFEIAESVYARHRAHAERFVQAVEELGSYLVVDDFTFDSAALDLLRSKALRLVKVDPELVAAALRDKLAQARIVAISQAARVLGVHCSAKRVEGEATRRWLAAAGFDFAAGPLFDAPATLASLAAELADPN